MKLPEEVRKKLNFNLVLLREYQENARGVDSAHYDNLHGNILRVEDWLALDKKSQVTEETVKAIREWLGWD